MGGVVRSFVKVRPDILFFEMDRLGQLILRCAVALPASSKLVSARKNTPSKAIPAGFLPCRGHGVGGSSVLARTERGG